MLHIHTDPTQEQLRLSDVNGSWDFWGGQNLHIRKNDDKKK